MATLEIKPAGRIASGRGVVATATLPEDCYGIGLRLDRSSWPVFARPIRVALEVFEKEAWRELGALTAHGGAHVHRNGQTSTVTTASFRYRSQRRAGAEVRVVIDAPADFDTRIDLTTDTKVPSESRITNSVTYDNSGETSGTSVASLSIGSFAIASNSNRAVFMMAGASAATPPTFTAWSWNTSEAMGETYDAVAQTFFRVGAARLAAPTATTAAAAVTFSATADEAYASVISLYDVDQASMSGTVQGNSGTTSPAWSGCASAADGMSVGFVYGDVGTTIADKDNLADYVSVGTANQSAGATSLSFTGAPAGRVPGMVEFCSIATENNNAISESSGGWTKLGSTVQQDASWQEELWYRVYNGSNVDPSFSWSGSVGCSGRRWLFADLLHTFGGFHTTNSGSGATHSITGQNSTANNSVAMYLSHSELNTQLGTDAGYPLEAFDAGSATGPYRLVVGARDQATSGAGADNFSATQASGVSWIMRLLELLAGPVQTNRQETESIGGGGSGISGSMSTETGLSGGYNVFGWTLPTPVAWHSIAFLVNVNPPAGGAVKRNNLALMGVGR